MSYQVLREDAEGEAIAEVPPAYPTSGGSPRGYVYVPLAKTSQEQPNTTAVVASQPHTLPQVSVVEPQLKPKPAMLIFSIVLTIVCGVHLCLPAFVCLTPALVFAIVGYSLSDSKEQKSTAKAFHGVSLCCNIASIVYYVLAAIATIVTLGVVLGLQYRDDNYYYEGRGCYEECNGLDYDYYGGTCPTICID